MEYVKSRILSRTATRVVPQQCPRRWMSERLLFPITQTRLCFSWVHDVLQRFISSPKLCRTARKSSPRQWRVVGSRLGRDDEKSLGSQSALTVCIFVLIPYAISRRYCEKDSETLAPLLLQMLLMENAVQRCDFPVIGGRVTGRKD